MIESNAMKMLKEWHTKFEVPVVSKPIAPPADRRKLRVSLIMEEANEFMEASGCTINNTGELVSTGEGDVIETADAIGDLLYVVYGAALEWGIPADAILEEVHRSNMSKVWEDGTVHKRADGKILKPPTYSPAMIEHILEDYS